MKIKKSISFYILISIVFCALYILLAIKPLETEYQFFPEWKIDATNPSVTPATEDDRVLPFKLGQTLGYFTPDGKITQFVTFPQKASISRSYYTSYNSNNTQAKYYSPDGKLSGTINVTGFPMIDEDRIFVFLPGGASFVKCTPDGQKEWEYGGTVPITAFDSSKSGVVIGFADGNICQFNTSGNLVQRFTPGGSDYNVILGAAISSSGEYIAVVSGQNRQRFVLAKRSENQTKITAHEFLNSNEPTQKLVKFSRDDSTVYFATSDDLGIVDVKTGKIRHIKLKGHANVIQESNESVFVLTKLEDTYTVYVIEKFATLTGAFSFSAKNAFILTDENRLYVGKDSTISCISISKK